MLIQDKERRGRFGHRILLEDWIIPVVYVNAENPVTKLEFIPSVVEETTTFPSSTLLRMDRDILDIEINLLSSKNDNIMLLKRFAGTGKSYLMRHLREWWRNTGLVERVVYFDFEENMKTVEDICRNIVGPERQGSLEVESFYTFPCGRNLRWMCWKSPRFFSVTSIRNADSIPENSETVTDCVVFLKIWHGFCRSLSRTNPWEHSSS
jgi:hypothetical protein